VFYRHLNGAQLCQRQPAIDKLDSIREHDENRAGVLNAGACQAAGQPVRTCVHVGQAKRLVLRDDPRAAGIRGKLFSEDMNNRTLRFRGFGHSRAFVTSLAVYIVG
jgi:hypothetical protein